MISASSVGWRGTWWRIHDPVPVARYTGWGVVGHPIPRIHTPFPGVCTPGYIVSSAMRTRGQTESDRDLGLARRLASVWTPDGDTQLFGSKSTEPPPVNSVHGRVGPDFGGRSICKAGCPHLPIGFSLKVATPSFRYVGCPISTSWSTPPARGPRRRCLPQTLPRPNPPPPADRPLS